MDLTPVEPQIDEGTIRAYCNLVFGYLSGPAVLRLIGETGTPAQKPIQRFATAETIADLIVKLAPGAARDQRAVFTLPSTLKSGNTARAADVLQTGVILVDLDHGDVAAKKHHLVLHLGAPSMEVASGGMTLDGQHKLHLYWRLSEAASGPDLDLVGNLRSEIASKVGGDASFASMSQPIRVAGTIHGKNGKRNRVAILTSGRAEYHLAEFADAVRLMPSMQGGEPEPRVIAVTGTSRPTASALATRIIREGGVDEATRYEAMSRIIGHWLRQVRHRICTRDEAFEAVLDHNAAMIRPPWEDERVHREFNALWGRDIANSGAMPDSPSGAMPDAPAFSEDALAQEFVRQAGTNWHHVQVWGSWFTWTGRQWQRDELGGAFEAVRQLCRSVAQSADTSTARKIASARGLQAVLKIASHDTAIACAPDAFDQHPMLLNTPAGVLDLQTGEIGSHDPALLLTQITRAVPGHACSQWRAFLAQVTGSDADLQAYLARVAGYCLSGSTQEQTFFFLHGSGANGKSVFLQTLAWVMGDYVATATADAFTDRGLSRHLTELAGLHAARMVLVTETEAGGAWAEARIKSVTGGEAIRANFMYKDHFEFKPQFKLLVAGNHRPSLTDAGEAMRRRLHVIPFAITIPPQERDPILGEHLKAEADGILGWMLGGCQDWQRKGLMPPAVVTGAAEEYFAAEDHIGQWIAECCHITPDGRAMARNLFSSWSDWAKANGFDPRSTRFLGEQLRVRGFRSSKVAGTRGWIGLALRHGSATEDRE